MSALATQHVVNNAKLGVGDASYSHFLGKAVTPEEAQRLARPYAAARSWIRKNSESRAAENS